MAHPLRSPMLASLAAATLALPPDPSDTSSTKDLENTQKFMAWKKLRDNPPFGPWDISLSMHEVEYNTADQSNLVNHVDLLFRNFMQLIHTYFHAIYKPEEQWMIDSLQLSVLQDRLHEHNQNVDLETIWDEQLFDEFDELDAFKEIDPPAGHEEIRAWLNNPNNFQFIQKIKHLDFKGLDLTILPEEIGLFTGLITLDLTENNIRYLPESIGNLLQLKKLTVCYNRLEVIPDSIGKLKHLEILDLTANSLRKIPASLCEANSLLSLELGENLIKSLPDEIGKLTQLVKLDLTDNNLEELPDTIGCLSKLRMLYLVNNELISLPLSVAQLQALEWLDVSENCLQFFPDQICFLSGLRILGMEYNMIGILPQTIMTMPNLTGLYIAGNPIVFLSDSELDQFTKPGINEECLTDNSARTLREHYERFCQYSCASGFATLVQMVGRKQSADQIQEAFWALESALREQIESKIRDLGQLDEENSSDSLVVDFQLDLLGECLIEVYFDRLETLSSEQQTDVDSKVWELYQMQEGPDGGEEEASLVPEKDRLHSHVLRNIDALELVINSPEEGRDLKRLRRL
ncbi:MAG: leucine-rich repeat domain-containing protein [Parachlamydiales bacterium]